MNDPMNDLLDESDGFEVVHTNDNELDSNQDYKEDVDSKTVLCDSEVQMNSSKLESSLNSINNASTMSRSIFDSQYISYPGMLFGFQINKISNTIRTSKILMYKVEYRYIMLLLYT